MNTAEALSETVELTVEDIRGVDEAAVSFSPDVTILTGHNTTNRILLLHALMAG